MKAVPKRLAIGRASWRGVLGLALLLAGSCSKASSPTAPTPAEPPTALPAQGPMLACPPPMNLLSRDGGGVVVEYAPQIMGGEPPVVIACSPASGSIFPVATTAVECTASDRLDQTDSCAFDITVSSPPMIAATRFLAFGDSITAGVVSAPVPTQQPRATSESYPSQLLAMLTARYTAQAITMENEGLSGEWAIDGVFRFPSALTPGTEVVLLLEGANDLNGLGAAIVDLAAGAVEQMVETAHSRGAIVFLANLPPQRGFEVDPALITNFNRQMANIAADSGAVFIDVFGALSTDVNRFIGQDGLHPTEDGYARMALEFYQAIRARLEVEP